MLFFKRVKTWICVCTVQYTVYRPYMQVITFVGVVIHRRALLIEKVGRKKKACRLPIYQIGGMGKHLLILAYTRAVPARMMRLDFAVEWKRNALAHDPRPINTGGASIETYGSTHPNSLFSSLHCLDPRPLRVRSALLLARFCSNRPPSKAIFSVQTRSEFIMLPRAYNYRALL